MSYSEVCEILGSSGQAETAGYVHNPYPQTISEFIWNSKTTDNRIVIIFINDKVSSKFQEGLGTNID